MTVLVSQVEAHDFRRSAIKAVDCASLAIPTLRWHLLSRGRGAPPIVLLDQGQNFTRATISPPPRFFSRLDGAVFAETDFDGCMRLVQEITGRKTLYLANSMNWRVGPDNRRRGHRAPFDWNVPDVMIIPGGNSARLRARARDCL